MAYATGAASTHEQLIDAINAFAVANGWTLDYAGADGSYKRLHISKNGCFANFTTNTNRTYYLMEINGSSGFAGSGIGAMSQTAPVSPSQIITRTPYVYDVLPCVYHLFANSAPDMLAGAFVSPNDEVIFFAVGNVEKIGAYGGGMFIKGGSLSPASVSGPQSSGIYSKNDTEFYQAYFYSLPPAVDSDTGMSPLVDMTLFEYVSGAVLPRGVLTHMRSCGRVYGNGDEIIYGGDTWKVFFDTSVNSPNMIAFRKT